MYRDIFSVYKQHILRNYWVYGIRKLIVDSIRKFDEVRPVTVASSTGLTHVAYSDK